jgi:16S rRNA (cytosine1402-N4)-methyltransferase
MDGTVGLGGHSFALLSAAGGNAEVLGIDRDESALDLAEERLSVFGDAAVLAQTSYGRFEAVLNELGWDLLDGAVLDLGVSSLQLDSPERGFSFLNDGPLDMRMGSAMGTAPASTLVNKASFSNLRHIIKIYGEDPMSGRIARAIIEAREKKPIETTLELAAVVEDAYPAKMRRQARNHPATRTFQALRMEVNRELSELEGFLKRIADRLKPGGRVAIISFHSLEDRLVKRGFRAEASGCVCPRHQPRCICDKSARLKILTKKPLTPKEEECAANPRARSAKLRVAERLPEPKLPDAYMARA